MTYQNFLNKPKKKNNDNNNNMKTKTNKLSKKDIYSVEFLVIYVHAKTASVTILYILFLVIFVSLFFLSKFVSRFCG